MQGKEELPDRDPCTFFLRCMSQHLDPGLSPLVRTDEEVLSVPIEPWQRPTIMMTSKDRPLSPPAEAFMDCVRELCKPLHGR